MPTGYTADIYSGDDATFEGYVWQVARGFGALISMRDAPRDAPIPETFDADTSYHDQALEEAREDLAALDQMTTADVLRAMTGERHEAEQRRAREMRRQTALRARYITVLAQAQEWEPPTADHVEFKRTMIEQLEESIKFDCGGADYIRIPEERTPPEWLREQRERIEASVARHTAEREKAIERARQRTAWVQALRDSLEAVKA